MISRQSFIKCSISLFSVLICLGVLEAAVRLLSVRDIDGEWRFRSTRLRPFALPVNRARHDIEQYLRSDRTSLIYDAELGWTQRPGVADHNDAGFITTGKTPELRRPEGGARIALFGDSFTQGSYREGWWRVLEDELRSAGVNAEVLNFGVGGYGMDQAYLRWKKDGARWKPDVVVFGFFAEDCYRNLNLFRMLRDPDSGIPFSKPRFIVNTTGKLELINSPTLPPAEIPPTLAEFASWPPAEHEWFFRASDFGMNGFRWSKLAALIEAKIVLARHSARAEEFFRLEGEATRIAFQILRRMREEVESNGGQFVVAHLPGITELKALRKSGMMPHQSLYAAVKREFSVIPLETSLLDSAEGKDPAPYFHDGHYAAEFNRVVGRTIAKHLRARVSDTSDQFQR